MTTPENQFDVFDEAPHQRYAFRPNIKSASASSIAGFIFSIFGLLSCGVASLIGIIFSIIGLRSEPRGLAVAGFIINLLGIAILLSSFFVGGGMMAMFFNMANFGQTMQGAQTRMEMDRAGSAIGTNWKETGTLPDQTAGDQLILGIVDGWNNQIEYETDGETFSLVSVGQDGVSGTTDDSMSGPFLEADEAISNSIFSINPTLPVIQNLPDLSNGSFEEESTVEESAAEQPTEEAIESDDDLPGQTESVDGDE